MVRLAWLKKLDNGKYRRTLEDKGRRVEPEQVLEWIQSKSCEYAPDNREFLQLRDKALICMLYLLCGRIGEILRLKKTQFQNERNFLVVNDYEVEKNRKNPYRDPWALPKKGRLAPFTHMILNYLNKLPKEQDTIFLIKRARAHQIVKTITGKWNHYFRAMGEAHLVHDIIKEPVKAACALRLRRSDTLIEYVSFEWRDYEKQLTA